ncbi:MULTISPECIES: acyltransferase [unclassified Campylobacter]|uniref:acyltransferase n=1 Tax=unclassified Campylobacter TaxID=2593542 RepID=UPI003D33A126
MKIFKKIKLWFYVNFIFDFISLMPTYFGIKLRRLFIKKFAKKCGKNFTAHDAVFFFYPKNLEIGDNVSISRNTIIQSMSRLTIGDNVMIASNCNIMTAHHGYSRSDLPMNLQQNTTNELIINDDVWIGNGVVLTSGARKVEIAKGVVIAANSVVTKSILEENTIWGGATSTFYKEKICA